MTRIAAGHPGIWPDICAENRTAIVDVLDGLLASLATMRRSWPTTTATACSSPRAGPAARVNLPARFRHAGRGAEVRVPVPDRTGVLAEVTTLAGTLDVNIADLEIAHSSEGERAC